MKLQLSKTTLFTLPWLIVLGGCLALDVPSYGTDLKPPNKEASYSVRMIKFAHSPDRPKKNYIGKASKKDLVDLDWHFWLVEGDGRKILIDPGFYREEIRAKQHTTRSESPAVLLNNIGINSSDITHILLTHLHEDVSDAVDLFGNSQIYISSGAYAYARSWRASNRAAANNVSEHSISYLENAERQGRLNLMDGTFDLFDGIKVYMSHLHTRFFSYYSVNTAKGPVVIASDLVPFFENIKKRRKITQTDNSSHLLKVYSSMKKMVGSTNLVLPRLDPLVSDKFESRSENVFEIAL